MQRKTLKKFLFFFMWIIFWTLVLSSVMQAEAYGKTPWQRLETKHTIIRYQSLEDLRRFDGKINFSPGEWSFKNLFTDTGSEDPIASLKKKMDAIYERVQEILDMRRKKLKKVIIKIYPNKERLAKAYTSFTGRECRIRAWYIFETNAIYMNSYDVHEGMLAHEMAHAIIDHYLLVRPPRVTAEILAHYVDEHLLN